MGGGAGAGGGRAGATSLPLCGPGAFHPPPGTPWHQGRQPVSRLEAPLPAACAATTIVRLAAARCCAGALLDGFQAARRATPLLHCCCFALLVCTDPLLARTEAVQLVIKKGTKRMRQSRPIMERVPQMGQQGRHVEVGSVGAGQPVPQWSQKSSFPLVSLPSAIPRHSHNSPCPTHCS